MDSDKLDMRTSAALIFFCAFVAAGFMIAVDSWDGVVYVYLGEQRSPAAVRVMGDFSAFDRKALFREAHQQLLAEAKIQKEGEMIALTLGHPLLKNTVGAGEFACPVQGRAGEFDRVEVTFHGVGISDGGEIPKMIVEANCRQGKSLSELETVYIPMAAVVKGGARDQDIEYGGSHPVSIHLQSMPGQWPDSWALWSVRFFRQNDPGKALIIDVKKIREANPHPLAFDWKSQ